jgi:hypothetical protein
MQFYVGHEPPGVTAGICAKASERGPERLQRRSGTLRRLCGSSAPHWRFDMSGEAWAITVFLAGAVGTGIGYFVGGFLKKLGEVYGERTGRKLWPKPPEEPPRIIHEHRTIGMDLLPVSPKDLPKNVTRLTAVQVNEAYTKSPPLQRDNLVKGFQGLRVDWEGYLVSARKDRDEIFTVLFHPAVDKSMPVISCKVDLNEYKQLALSEARAKVRLLGEIKNVDQISIDLKNVHLIFDP